MCVHTSTHKLLRKSYQQYDTEKHSVGAETVLSPSNTCSRRNLNYENSHWSLSFPNENVCQTIAHMRSFETHRSTIQRLYIVFRMLYISRISRISVHSRNKLSAKTKSPPCDPYIYVFVRPVHKMALYKHFKNAPSARFSPGSYAIRSHFFS